MSDREKDLVERDRNVIWHPFSQQGLNHYPLPVTSAQGAYLKLADGREILDAISSWWVNIHGHCHPRIVKAVQTQASTLEHVLFARFTHEPAVQFAEALVEYPAIRNANLCRVFYSDNGSCAVEAALKMAYQYHLNRGSTGRHRFLALHDAYHGDTLGAMAVGEPSGFTAQFRRLTPKVDFVKAGDLDGLRTLIQENGDSYAAFIFEPMVQGVAGMKMVSSEFLNEAVQVCQEAGIVAIADEVFTGFYRTGKCFAFEYLGIKPDLVCLSKGITGGFLPLAVTLVTEKIYEAFLSKDVRTAFLHGHSYTANPIACAAALESWKLLHAPECLNQIEMISSVTEKFIREFESHPRVGAARCLGTIGAVELKQNSGYFSLKTRELSDFCMQRNVLLRPLGDVIYAVPPYCVTAGELEKIYKTILEFIEMDF